MEKNDVFEYLAGKPDVLLEIIGEILKNYRDITDKLGITESKKQLVEISKTIDRLESTGITVPDELRSLKSSLLTGANEGDKAQTQYEILIKGLKDLCSKFNQNGNSKPKGRSRNSENDSPVKHGRLTPRNTLIRAIVQVMEQMGNSGNNKEIHQKLEIVLADVLTPEDYELDSSGRVIWYHQVDWARMYMAKVGMIKNDSPRGVWELSERYKELLGGLK